MITYALFDDSFFQKKPWWMLQKLYNVVCNRSNPRSKNYMTQLLHKKFPGVKVIGQIQDHTQGDIILLYSDSIGLGLSKLEGLLMKQNIKIKVLNGRGRIFNFNSSVRKQLLFRRFLEVTFLPEILFSPILFICGIVLVLKDKLSNRVS
jgi:hypothetical protein